MEERKRENTGRARESESHSQPPPDGEPIQIGLNKGDPGRLHSHDTDESSPDL